MEYLDKETSDLLKKARAKRNWILVGIIAGFIVLVYFMTIVRIGVL